MVRSHSRDDKTRIEVYLKTKNKIQVTSPIYFHLQDGENSYAGTYNTAKKPNYTIATMLNKIKSKEDANLHFSDKMEFIVEKHLESSVSCSLL